MALGESYEKLDKVQDAMKCFWKAYCVGDIEGGIALLRLAKLFDVTNEPDQAAAAYERYIQESDQQGADRDEQAGACRYLAKYFLKQDLLDEAQNYVMKCSEFSDAKEEDKSLLKEIASRRGMVLETGAQTEIGSRLRSSPRREFGPINLNFTP